MQVRSLVFCVLILSLCCGFSGCSAPVSSSDRRQESRVQEILGDQYMVSHKLASGGESDIYGVYDTQGKNFVAKYWASEKENDFLIRTSGFQNSIDTHRILERQPFMVALRQVVGDKIMVLDYLDGISLGDYYNSDVSKAAVRGVTRQTIAALEDMCRLGVVTHDLTSENIMVLGRENPRAVFIDPASYILTNLEKKRCKDEQGSKPFKIYNQDVIKIDGRKRNVSPAFALGISLTEIVYLLNTLLTRCDPDLRYKGFKKLEFDETKLHLDTFGVWRNHTINILSPELKEKMEGLMKMPAGNIEGFEDAIKEKDSILDALLQKTYSMLVQFKKHEEYG